MDDEPDVCETVSLILEQHGAQVRTATSAAEALALIAAAAAGRAGGRPVHARRRRLRADAAGSRGGRPHPRGRPDRLPRPPNHRGRAEEAGYQLFLEKPIDVDELTAKLAELALRGPVATDLTSLAHREVDPRRCAHGWPLYLVAGARRLLALAGRCQRADQQRRPQPYVPKQSDRPAPATEDEPGSRPSSTARRSTGWEGNPKYWRVENGALVGEITPDDRHQEQHLHHLARRPARKTSS